MILITGATGTVGSEVVKRLSAQGRQARALTRDLRKVKADEFPHIEFVQGDFDDADSLQRACSGVEQVFLLSNSTERAEQQQIGFVEAARKSGVRHREALAVARRRELAWALSPLPRRSRSCHRSY